MNHTTSHLHTASCELDMARTYAASLHLATTPRQYDSRLNMALACCAAARTAAVRGGLTNLVTQADDLVDAIYAAVLPAAAIAA